MTTWKLSTQCPNKCTTGTARLKEHVRHNNYPYVVKSPDCQLCESDKLHLNEIMIKRIDLNLSMNPDCFGSDWFVTHRQLLHLGHMATPQPHQRTLNMYWIWTNSMEVWNSVLKPPSSWTSQPGRIISKGQLSRETFHKRTHESDSNSQPRDL